jgi:[acyl-carrier-protein] S-malonyltransferase
LTQRPKVGMVECDMFKIAVFPGQGSQRKNMSLDFVAEHEEARRTFQEASDALHLDMLQLVSSDDESLLNLTANAQPAIVTAEIAIYRSLIKMYGLGPDVFGGHSLGEYTALVAAGVIPFFEAVKLVRVRGTLMQDAAPVGLGGMAAIIAEALPLEKIDQLCAAHQIDIANDNSLTQVVLSGEKTALDSVLAKLPQIVTEGDLRIVPLEVSAPFHSRHMAILENSFKEVLTTASHTFDPANLDKVTSNVSGTFYTKEIITLIDLLTRQISGRVRWRDNMASLLARSNSVVEIGPNRPLSGFFKTLRVACASVMDMRSATRAFEPK